MDFLQFKAGDKLEVGAQPAFRFWRYAFTPDGIKLLSWVSDKHWRPGQDVEGTSPDVGEQGIHGFKTMDDLLFAVRFEPERLVMRSQLTDCDGVVIGGISLWGVIWDHNKGYRAQYAKPTSFTASYGRRSDEALSALRNAFELS